MNFLYLTFLLPALGYLLLATLRTRLTENVAAIIGVGSVAGGALVTLLAGVEFLGQTAPAVVKPLWQWMEVANFSVSFGLHLDGLSLTMLGVITGVGTLIHLFASWYMRGEAGFERFFSYMNLFVASMVLLVLGDNLLVLYLGWEGVGLCSYLLIGFYYSDRANGAAAIKAFTVTRVGDVFLLLGIFMVWWHLGTVDIQQAMTLAAQKWQVGDPTATLITLLLVGGAFGKSAQLPLQTWLADAMAGPTPVSALIHAATMVTAGVYLIARTHGLFLLAPEILTLVGTVGAFTLVLSGFSAMVQTDIKRVLAYSTMSQLGYMFLALGVSAWDAAIFHLMTHAFFKALLFLSAGAVIIACHHEQDIFRMGGLWRRIPLVYACFLVGGGALAAFPFLTVGFYSKDAILWHVWASGHTTLFWAALGGALLTSVYTTRLILLVFHGEEKTHAHAIHGVSYWLPLSILLVLSTGVGALINQPLGAVLPATPSDAPESVRHGIEMLAMAAGVTGLVIGWLLFRGQRRWVSSMAASTPGRILSSLWKGGWGFDQLYDVLFVKPYRWIANLNRDDAVLRFVDLSAPLALIGQSLMAMTANGKVRWYAMVMLFGASLALAAVTFLQ